MSAETSKSSPTVLVVDDEPDIRELARLILEMDGLVVDEAANGDEALAWFIAADPPPNPSAVILDNRMPGLSGIQVAEKMLALYPEQVIVLFSAYLDRELEEAAKAAGVALCVSKTEVRSLPAIIRGLLAAA